MKKSFYVLLILTVITLLSACHGEAPLSPSEPDGAASPGSVEDGTIGAVCRDALLAFESDPVDNPLVSLSYQYGQAHSFEIMDQAVLAEIYPTLLSVPLGNETDDPGTLDANIVFSFVRKNGEEFTVRFVTLNYFALYAADSAAWKYYKVPDASLVSRCQDAAMAANKESVMPEKPIFGDMFALDIAEDSCDSIDLDGDGQNDWLFFDFIDNGDEAYGALELSVNTAGSTFQMNFYPAEKETIFVCGVPYAGGRSLLIIMKEEKGGWPGCLYFITVKYNQLMQYSLEDVEIIDYSSGVFTLSDQRTADVAQMDFKAVEQ